MKNLTVYELALLFALAEKFPVLYTHIEKLYVVERECTGVGQYIYLKYYDSNDILPISEGILSVDKVITTEGLEVGLGFVGVVENSKLVNLELFVYGSDDWDCVFKNFSLKKLNDL